MKLFYYSTTWLEENPFHKVPCGTGGPGEVQMQRMPFLDDPREGGETNGGGETDSRQRAVSGEEEREVLLVVVEGSEIGRVTAKALQVKVPG